jgi:hypothetical protein
MNSDFNKLAYLVSLKRYTDGYFSIYLASHWINQHDYTLEKLHEDKQAL